MHAYFPSRPFFRYLADGYKEAPCRKDHIHLTTRAMSATMVTISVENYNEVMKPFAKV